MEHVWAQESRASQDANDEIEAAATTVNN